MGMSLWARDEQVGSLDVNVWNWRPTVEILRRAGAIDELTYLMWQSNTGHGVDAATAARIAAAIEAALDVVPEQHRLLLDGTTTAEPDDLVIHADSRDYSTTRAWLVEFSSFVRRSSGFSVY